jgi:hypothetical protein
MEREGGREGWRDLWQRAEANSGFALQWELPSFAAGAVMCLDWAGIYP